MTHDYTMRGDEMTPPAMTEAHRDPQGRRHWATVMLDDDPPGIDKVAVSTLAVVQERIPGSEAQVGILQKQLGLERRSIQTR